MHQLKLSDLEWFETKSKEDPIAYYIAYDRLILNEMQQVDAYVENRPERPVGMLPHTCRYVHHNYTHCASGRSNKISKSIRRFVWGR